MLLKTWCFLRACFSYIYMTIYKLGIFTHTYRKYRYIEVLQRCAAFFTPFIWHRKKIYSMYNSICYYF